jgi:hypothetical protein
MEEVVAAGEARLQRLRVPFRTSRELEANPTYA